MKQSASVTKTQTKPLQTTKRVLSTTYQGGKSTGLLGRCSNAEGPRQESCVRSIVALKNATRTLQATRKSKRRRCGREQKG